MTRLRVGVPPGVGDVYWCLTKLRSIANGRPVTLCVQGSRFERALEWAGMVDFIDQSEALPFKPQDAERNGIRPGRYTNVDFVLWPNAVIDRGERIETWLPQFDTDLTFHVEHEDMGEPRVVVFPSSMSSASTWMTGRGPEFWSGVIEKLSAEFGRVTVVGKAWDLELKKGLRGDFEDLVDKTSLRQLAGLLKSARVVVGIISGVTILANHFRTPAVAVWPDSRFPETFPSAWVAPDAPYYAVPASSCTAGGLVRAARAVAR